MSTPLTHGLRRGLVVTAAVAAFAITPAAAAQQKAAQGGAAAVAPDLKAAIDKTNAGDPSALFKLADAGRPDAQFFAGGVLIFGQGTIARDPARGCAYEEKASATRADAMHLVGECYRRGLAGTLDKAKAQAAYTRAVEMGSTKSKCILGEMLFADPAQAQRGLTLCKELAETGDAEAQTKVGGFYFRGSGPVKANQTEARRWYEMAAKQKQPEAARTLGQMYAKGEGGKRDPKKAMEWWLVAEKAGDPMVAILVGDQLFSDMTGGRTPGPGKFAFKGGVPLADIEVVEDWYRQAQEKDPRPDVQKRATAALSVLAYFKTAAKAPTATKSPTAPKKKT